MNDVLTVVSASMGDEENGGGGEGEGGSGEGDGAAAPGEVQTRRVPLRRARGCRVGPGLAAPGVWAPARALF